MPEPTSEDWAQIRYEYEHTERPIEAICAPRGISAGTLRDRVRRWGWTPRRARIPPAGPPPTRSRRPPRQPAAAMVANAAMDSDDATPWADTVADVAADAMALPAAVAASGDAGAPAL
jgi:hypothetical protein